MLQYIQLSCEQKRISHHAHAPAGSFVIEGVSIYGLSDDQVRFSQWGYAPKWSFLEEFVKQAVSTWHEFLQGGWATLGESQERCFKHISHAGDATMKLYHSRHSCSFWTSWSNIFTFLFAILAIRRWRACQALERLDFSSSITCKGPKGE